MRPFILDHEMIRWAIEARLRALWCEVRGHDVVWRDGFDPWIGCTGDIICKTCNAILWCRHGMLKMRLAQFVCGALGHLPAEHPTNLAALEEILHQPQTFCVGWLCPRCCAELGGKR